MGAGSGRVSSPRRPPLMKGRAETVEEGRAARWKFQKGATTFLYEYFSMQNDPKQASRQLSGEGSVKGRGGSPVILPPRSADRY